uniref:MFS domain-containing protein n=1 Tax=Caenorhabditis tropicalis TaxID=1561998 RepID=A0A1I7TS22_9PELO
MSWQTVRLISFYAVLSAITNFPSGFTNSSVNTAVEKLHKFIVTSFAKSGETIDQDKVALFQSATLNCWFVSQIFGSLMTPLISDRYGRRVGYIVCVSTTIFATFVQYFSICFYSPWGLMIGRSLTAIVSPLGDACLLLYVQETAPTNIRGMASFLCEIGYGSMCVLGMVLGMESVLGDSLSRLLLLSMVPLIFSLTFVLQIPETPKYLMITRNDKEKAGQSLEFFRGPSPMNEEQLKEYEKERMTERESRNSKYVELWSRWHLRQSMRIAIATLCLTLSFYPILQSSTYFLLESGVPGDQAQLFSTLSQVVLTLSSIFGASIIDRYSRRKLLISFGILSNILLICFSFFSSLSSTINSPALWPKYACLASLLGYCISFGMILGPLSWFVAPELVSQRHRCTIFSACFAIHNLLIALTDFATIPLFRIYGSICFIYLFVGPSIFCLFYIYLYMPETLKKSTLEIINEIIDRGEHKPPKSKGMEEGVVQVRDRLFQFPDGEIEVY